MASRIRNSRRQVLRKSDNNATILNGRADFIMVGNRLIILQESKDGTVSEVRFNMADSTYARLGKAIQSTLKNKQRQTIKIERKPRKTLAERLADMEATKNRKLGLIA